MKELLLGSVLSALATGAGALPILFLKQVSHRAKDGMMAFAAGIMVAATMFTLIPEALQQSSAWVVAAGVLMGTALLGMLEKVIPHIELEHARRRMELTDRGTLVIAAITLHNIPEGLSVGVSYAGGDGNLGGLIALAIGFQNAPEGLLVALFLVHQGMKRAKAVLIAALTGTLEIAAAVAGYAGAAHVAGGIPYGLAFAGGAMLYLVYKELIPESHGDGHETQSTYAFIGGVLAMLFLGQAS